MKFDVVDGSVLNGLKQQTQQSLISDKPSGYKVFRGPKLKQFKKQTIMFGRLQHFIWKMMVTKKLISMAKR